MVEKSQMLHRHANFHAIVMDLCLQIHHNCTEHFIACIWVIKAKHGPPILVLLSSTFENYKITIKLCDIVVHLFVVIKSFNTIFRVLLACNRSAGSDEPEET